MNLLDNALEASPPGAPVWIAASYDSEEACIVVRDHGTGMSPSTLSRAFELHFSTKSRENAGLGLTISRDIVESLGGKLDLQSDPSGGTVATLRLPIPAVGTASAR